MTDIQVGSALTINDGTNTEVVVVKATTSTTFTAVFVNSYTGPVTVSAAPFLVEMNNQEMDVLPTYAWIKLRGIVGGDPYYEFMASTLVRWVRIPATLITSDISAGTQTVSPLSMTGIFVGCALLIVDFPDSVGGTPTCPEVVIVTATTATTFTATFAADHGESNVYRALWCRTRRFPPVLRLAFKPLRLLPCWGFLLAQF